MAKYKIGDMVYLATYNWSPYLVACPVCFHTLKVTLILGNGDQVTLPCEHCKSGYESPTGQVTEYDYIPKVEKIIIDGMAIELNGTTEKVTYKRMITSNSWNSFEENQLFPTEEEAKVESERLKTEWELKNIHNPKKAKRKEYESYSRSAGYHIREANQLRQRVVYHERMATICKSKIKK